MMTGGGTSTSFSKVMDDMNSAMLQQQTRLLVENETRMQALVAEQDRLKALNEILYNQLKTSSNDVSEIYRLKSILNAIALKNGVTLDHLIKEHSTATLPKTDLFEVAKRFPNTSPTPNTCHTHNALSSEENGDEEIDALKTKLKRVQEEKAFYEGEIQDLKNKNKILVQEILDAKQAIAQANASHQIALEKRRIAKSTISDDQICADVARWNSNDVVSSLANARLDGVLAEARQIAVRVIPALCDRIQALEKQTRMSRSPPSLSSPSWQSPRGGTSKLNFDQSRSDPIINWDSVKRIFSSSPESASIRKRIQNKFNFSTMSSAPNDSSGHTPPMQPSELQSKTLQQ